MPNYTTTRFESEQLKGASIFFNNMITSGSITITPNLGFVVSASSFSVTTLPSNVSSVVFTDTTTAGALGNKVTATVNFSSETVLNSDLIILLDIQGDAVKFNENLNKFSLSTKIIDNNLINDFGSSSFVASTGYTFATTTSSGISTTNISASLFKNTLTKIGELTVTATSGYYFKQKPYLAFIDDVASPIQIKTKSTTTNSDNLITAYVFNIMAIVDTDISTENINLKYSAIKILEQVKTITRFSFGSRKVSKLGATRDVFIYGTPGAEVNILFNKDSDGSSIIDTTNFFEEPSTATNVQRIIANGVANELSISKKIPSTKSSINYCHFIQKFPAGTGTYTAEIIPKNGTTLQKNVASKYTLHQLANPVITLAAASANVNVRIDVGSSYTFTGRPISRVTNLNVRGIRVVNEITVKATALNGHAFQTPSTPVFSKTDASSSNWTNSVPSSTQGFNHFNIDKITVARSSANTVLTINYVLFLEKFGSANATSVLNLDNIVTTA
jgi:hypothetical protein